MRWLNRTAAKQTLNRSKFWHLLLSRTGIFCGLFGSSLLLSGVAGANWGMTYTQERIAPHVARLLSQTLNRPVQLGNIEQVFPGGLRLGASAIPATATDADAVTVKAIDIHFNMLETLSQGKIGLTVTLIQPTVFVDQNAAGTWLDTELVMEGEELVEVNRIRLRDATIELAPTAKVLESLQQNPEAQGLAVAPNRVTLQHVNLDVTLSEAEQRLTFNVNGQPSSGGKFRSRGRVSFRDNTATVNFRSDKLSVMALNPFLPPTVRLDAGSLTSQLKLRIRPEAELALQGTATLDNLAAQVEGEPNLFTRTSGQFRFQGQTITVKRGRTNYGQIPFDDIVGTIHLQDGLDLHAKVHEVQAQAFMDTFELEVPFPVQGTLSSTDLRVTGPLAGAIFAGTVESLQPIHADRLQLASLQGKFTFNTGTDLLSLHTVAGVLQTGGTIATQGNILLGEEDEGEPDEVRLAIQVQDLATDAIAQLYDIVPPQPLGKFNATGTITVLEEKPDLTLDWQLVQGSYPAQGRVTLANDTLRLQDLQLHMGNGTVTATGALQNNQWQFTAQSTDLPLKALVPDLPGTLTGSLNLAGTSDRLLESMQGTMQASAEIDGETLTVDGDMAQGEWQAQIRGRDIPLKRFSAELPGTVGAEVKLAGNLTELSPDAIQAEGHVQLSQGISQQLPLLNQPLTADLRWDDGKLHIQRATAAGLDLDGWVATNLENGKDLAIDAIDLNVHLQDYDLATLPLQDLPVPIQGTATFEGRITGTPSLPQLQGALQLQHLTVHQFTFAPLLDGTVALLPDRGVTVLLAGEDDKIAFTTDAHYQFEQLEIQVDQSRLQASVVPTAQTDAARFRATIQNFPVEKLGLNPNIAGLDSPIAGLFSGEFALDLTDRANPLVEGDFTLDRPAIGILNAAPTPAHANDRFVGSIRYGDGALALSNGALHLGTGHYQVNGRFTPGSTPQFSGNLTTDSGNIQELLAILPEAEWRSVLATVGAPAWLQYSQSAPSEQLLAADLDGSSVPLIPLPDGETPIPALPLALPGLSELHGNFSTEVAIHGSEQTGLAAEFSFHGQGWEWGQYGVRDIKIAQGRFDAEGLSLQSAQLQGLSYSLPNQSRQDVDTLVTFTGQVGQHHDGQLQIERVPLAFLGRLFNLPIPIAGNLTATATLAGEIDNPQVNGSVEAIDIQLNARKIKDLQVLFNYHNNQFRIEDWRLREE